MARSRSRPGAEQARLAESTSRHAGDWKALGPWLSERAWGTVREDYSADGDPWRYFPHDHARSRAYRWTEDGLAGFCDAAQHMCFALAFWNGRDPILKERIYGLSGPEGNHGEDAKEYWWYEDATPTASWLRWRYHYPQSEFPYDRLRAENVRRGRDDPEFELADTEIFDAGRYWIIVAEYAKASPRDVCIRLTIRNAGPEAASLHVLPTLWFRNRWSWGGEVARPLIRADDGDAGAVVVAVAEDPLIGRWSLTAGEQTGGARPTLLFCDNETNTQRLFGVPAATRYPKDGINDHVTRGAETVNPTRCGTKMSCWYRLEVPAGQAVELRLRLARQDRVVATDLGAEFEQVLAAREREADEYFAGLRPAGASDEEAGIMRQAFAGMTWGQQFYHLDVARWLDGDKVPPPESRRGRRNSNWRHVSNHDILAMPDKWEYPWYAAWDLGFHCVVLAHTDPEAAKHQLLLLCREWYMHPNGQLPAYEWSFDDVNPPVHAWAALRVFAIDGARDLEFLARAFQKLLINFTWWVNRKDVIGDNIFEGGFLGLDNIGAFDRSTPLPDGWILEQSDGTAWMAKYCLNMLEIALRLANHDRAYEDVALKFFEHFCTIARASRDLWSEDDGFFYDRLRKPDGTTIPLRARSIVGLLPLFAAVRVDPRLWEQLSDFRARARWYIEHNPWVTEFVHVVPDDKRPALLSLVDDARLRRVLVRMLDEQEFLSPRGLRSLSRYHKDHPLVVPLPGGEARLDYEPATSTSGLFGGNSNWRGPVWAPFNYLALESLRNLHECFGETFTVELPAGSGRRANLCEVADALERRFISLFVRGADGRRASGDVPESFRRDPTWRDPILFHEYFDGDTGAGLGASHQTGWTALVGAMIADRRRRRSP